MAGPSNGPEKTVRNTNRLFLGTLCFVMAVSFWMGRSGISLSGEMNLIVSQLLFWTPIVNVAGCHENKSTASDSISQNLCFHDADGDLICHIADSGDGMD